MSTAYTFQLQISNYENFLAYLQNTLGDTIHANIHSMDWNSMTNIVTFYMIQSLSDKEVETFNASVNNYTNDYIAPPKYLYVNQLFPQVQVVEQDFKTVFSWKFNGTDLDNKFIGVALSTRLDPQDDDDTTVSQYVYNIRVVDVNNITILGTITTSNIQDTTHEMILSNLPTKAATFEIQVKKGMMGSRVCINSLQFIENN